MLKFFFNILSQIIRFYDSLRMKLGVIIYCISYDYYHVTRILCTDRRVSRVISTEPTGFPRMYVIDGNVPKGVLLLQPHY